MAVKTCRRWLRERAEGYHPVAEFVAAYLNCMVATGFFCKIVSTPLGRKLAKVLVFVHLGARKVFVSPSTFHPTGEWMRQQTRNVSMGVPRPVAWLTALLRRLWEPVLTARMADWTESIRRENMPETHVFALTWAV